MPALERLLGEQTILDRLPLAVYVCSAPGGEIVYYNRYAAELWGRAPQIGETNLRFCGSCRLYHADGSPLPHEETPMAQAVRLGTSSRDQEVVVERPDGSRITVLVNIDPVRDAEGRVVAAVNAFRDVTARRETQALQARLAAIVESSDDAIIGKDLNGVIQSWNRGAERLFGYTADEVIGCHVSMLAAPDRVDEIPGILERIRRGEQVDHYETRRRTKDGRIITVSLTVSPILDSNGRVTGISKIARDISDRERSFQALREANAALSRANADLEQFAFAVSHDLQEPVRNILIYAQLLKERYGEALNRDAKEFLSTVWKGAQRIEALIRDLLVYTQVSGEAAGAEQAVDAGEVWGEVVESHSALLARTSASVQADALPMVRMQRGHLLQVFGNLLNNALKYRSKEPPRIHLSVRRIGGQWLFSLRDNGIGIDPMFFGQIFGVFKRLHSAESYPGTGIGLAICQRIVQRYGGQIWVDSTPGAGAVFHFTVPGE